MTDAPGDLVGFRHAVQAETGLTDPADVGIVGDGVHAKTGGYHEGRSVLILIGRFHASARAGSLLEDYSARLARDRMGLTEDSSAVDIASEWPRGGRAAWLRFNRMLVAALQAVDRALSAVRAINYSPDGTARHRIDREHGFSQVDDTTDSVTIHTHLEFYRDTANNRQVTLDRIIQLIRAAIANVPAPPSGSDEMEEEDMYLSVPEGVAFKADNSWLDTTKVLTLAVPLVSALAPRWVCVAGNQDSVVRVVYNGGGHWDGQDVHCVFADGGHVLGLPAGTTEVLIGYKSGTGATVMVRGK